MSRRIQEADGIAQVKLQARRVVLYLASCLLFLSSSGCGFQLRGTGGAAALPASLSSVRVIMAGPAANEPLAVAVREALAQAGAQVVEADASATLALFDERVETRVASVSTATAKASAYMLHYSVGFRLDGPQPAPAQTIRLQRDYSFDPAQVLAKEQQEQELLRDMRRDAARQIVRRLARVTRR